MPILIASPALTLSFSAGRQPAVEHVRPVGAAELFDVDLAAVADVEARVPARRLRVGEVDVRVFAASDDHLLPAGSG